MSEHFAVLYGVNEQWCREKSFSWQSAAGDFAAKFTAKGSQRFAVVIDEHLEPHWRLDSKYCY